MNGLSRLNIQYPSLQRAHQGALQTIGMGQDVQLGAMRLQDYPEERAHLAKTRSWEEEDRARAIERFKFQDQDDAVDYLIKTLPFVSLKNYAAGVKHYTDLGANPDLFRDPASFKSEEEFEGWKNQGLYGLQKLKQEGKETPAEKRAADLKKQKNLAKYKAGLTDKETPSEKRKADLAADKELAKYKAGLTEDELSAKEKEIEEYLGEGIAEDRKEAVKLAYGIYKVETTDMGDSFIVDTSDGSVVRALETPRDTEQTATGGPPTTKEEPFLNVDEAKAATGPASGFKQALNNLVGWAYSGVIFEETEAARNKMNIFNQRMKPLLKVSRYGAKFDIENIENMLPNPKRFFQDPDAAVLKLQNLDSFIRSTIAEKNRIITDDKTTRKQRQKLVEDIGKLSEALNLLPDKEAFSPNAGLSVENIRNMSAAAIKELDIQSLTTEQREAVEERTDELLSQQGQ